MNESEQYIANAIHTWVWSGFYSLADIHTMIDDIIEPDADEHMLANFAESELKAKLEAEASWSPVTDCDRLNAAFAVLETAGIIALHNAGYTMSEGRTEVAETLATTDQREMRGYCFYHGQDVERAIGGDGLTLAFGDLTDTREGAVAIGNTIKEELACQGFVVEWDGSPERRINIPKIDWQRRAA